MNHVDQNRLIKSYYIEQIYILQNRDPDSHIRWSYDRDDVWIQLQDIIEFQKNNFGYDVYIKHFTSSRDIYGSLNSFSDHFKYKTFTKKELQIRQLPMFTQVTIYNIEDLYTKGMAYIEEIELISLVALVVR